MGDFKLVYEIKNLDHFIFRLLIKDCQIFKDASVFTPTQMQIVDFILKNKEKTIFQGDLEQVLNLRRATVSGVLKTMEKNELIQRINYLGDTRKKQILLHPKAEKIFFESQEKIEALENLLKKGLSENDLEIFLMLIKKMQENIACAIQERSNL